MVKGVGAEFNQGLVLGFGVGMPGCHKLLFRKRRPIRNLKLKCVICSLLELSEEHKVVIVHSIKTWNHISRRISAQAEAGIVFFLGGGGGGRGCRV